MLLTMRHEANRRGFIMPTPERLWKVSEHRVSGTVKAKPEGGGGGSHSPPYGVKGPEFSPISRSHWPF